MGNRKRGFIRTLNIIGLVLNMLGTGIIFRWGLPQPDFSTKTAIVLEDSNRDAQSNASNARELIAKYTDRSHLGLEVLGSGFVLQLLASVV